MTKAEFAQMMGCEKTVIGMVHLLPLPGSPRYGGSMRAVFEAALRDLKALEGAGVKAAVIENFGDVPYGTENEFITLACMTSVAAQLRERTTMKLGINVQYNCAVEEWGMAYASGANFIRVEAFVETRVGTHGITYPAAPALMREKGRYPAPTLLFCDVNTKHTEPLVPVPIADSIHEAIEEGADALIVTGVVTGQNPTLEQVQEFAAAAGDTPVLLGSGVNEKNAAEFFAVADGAIIGSSFKEEGNVWNPVDPQRVQSFMQTLTEAGYQV
ncbi:BtpA/SgcQ family protein [bacterium 210820-DFI.6.52]|nr:BtpA/SgcQ family protein [bacterium 210820-DFI.6.52]